MRDFAAETADNKAERATVGSSDAPLTTTHSDRSRGGMADVKSIKTPSVIQCQLRLKLRPAQERMLKRWLWHLSSVYNWAIRKIELDKAGGVVYGRSRFQNLLAGHSQKLGIPSHVIQGTLSTAHDAWGRCFKKLARKPRLKGRRNRLNSIPFPDPITSLRSDRVTLLGVGSVRFHKQDVPTGRIKSARAVKRASGWHLCLFIEAVPSLIPRVCDGQVGIDPGFATLLTLSTGEKIEHPRELEHGAARLGQASRGRRAALVARLQERQANRRKDRNHKISRRLLSENALIVWSRDNHVAIAQRFGRSVSSSTHSQLRQMLSYKCRTGGRRFVEVSNRNSTRTCSACGGLSGPTGLAGLKVRTWECVACGAIHDRDINAAVNTLKSGLGTSHESGREAASGIAS
jgi:putative transposase